MRSPAALPALAVVGGVALGVTGHADHFAGCVPLVVAVLVLLATVAWLRPRRRRAALLLALAGAGSLHGAGARHAALAPTLRTVLDRAYGGFAVGAPGVGGRHDPVRLRAILTEDASDGGDTVSLRAASLAVRIGDAWIDVDGAVVLGVGGETGRERASEWRKGRTIEAPVTFRRPARYLDAGVPDGERDAALAGIALLGSVKSGLLVDVVRKGSVADEITAGVRASVRAAVSRRVGPQGPVAAAIVTAVLIGDRSSLPDTVRTRLQLAGTYHVIAISGGNIAIFAALILGVFALTGVHGRYAALATIAALAAYAQIAAAGPSVWRATLMAMLYLAARVLDHRTPVWHAVAVAAFLLVLVRPLDVRDAGFLLTFGATIGLLAIPRWTESISTRRAVVWLLMSLLASVAAELALLPVSARVFSRVTGAGLALNLLAIPAMTVVQIAGLAVVLFDRVALVGSAAGWIAGAAATLLVESARAVDYVPWLVRRVPPPPAWLIAAYYLTLVTAHLARTRRARLAAAGGLALAAVLILVGVSPLPFHRNVEGLRLTMLDVGQGESLLLDVAGADPLLVDTGGAAFGGGFDIGGRVLAPALWGRGVRRLGDLLVTHGDPDHIGGALTALTDFRPGTLWWGIPVPPHAASESLRAAAAARGQTIRFARQGQLIARGAARLRVLNPPEPDWERRRVRNDDSVVLEVIYGDVALLLTGDISAEVERALVPQLTPARVRVLKVAHHGSRTSTSAELLDAWRPQIALISCGRGNTFGHPAAEVLDRLAATGTRVYRTDRDGAITLQTDGSRLSVTTFVRESP